MLTLGKDGKLDHVRIIDAEQADAQGAKPAAAPKARGGGGAAAASTQAEALSALSNLGYGPGEAAQAVAQAAGEDPEADTPALIRAALKLLAPKG